MLKRGNSRGLSTIVATLLVILLTLVAVGIIWVVVKNVIQQGAEQVSLGKFTLNLEIKNVGIDPASPNYINVKIRRNPGAGDIAGLNFIIDDGDTTEVVKLENLSLNELEERTINISLKSITNASKIQTVSVAPIFRLESGKEVTGDVKDEYTIPKSSGTTVSTGCLSGSECNDGNACTTDSCNSGMCSHVAITSCVNSDGCCPSGCTLVNDSDCSAVCGNGIRETGEGCDDGDISSGDGCSSSCTVESGYTCNTATPNVCTQTCTDNCNSLNYNCDYHTICGSNISCGTCSGGQTCNSTGRCVTSNPAWQNGMVSWWRFNGNANDYTGKNNGTVNGATLTSTNCKSGQCYSFDGVNDLINLSKLSGWNDLGAMSLSVWVRPVSVSGGSGNTIFAKNDNDAAPWGFWGINLLAGNEIYYARDTTGSNFYVYSASDSVTMGQMQNVVVTWTGSGTTGSMHFYVNGVETEYDSQHWDGSGTDNGLNNFYIGNIGTKGLPFNGIIDEVMLFNRSLSSSEVQQIYNYNYP
jgi:cysteine-rich repeat protein